jgi:hypothetical protein
MPQTEPMTQACTLATHPSLRVSQRACGSVPVRVPFWPVIRANRPFGSHDGFDPARVRAPGAPYMPM